MKLVGQYNWTTESVMWALPGRLSPEESQFVQRDSSVVINPSRLETLLGKHDGVKIAFDETEGYTEHSQLRLVAIGQSNKPVLIAGVRAYITKRERPLSGTLIYAEPQGEGVDIQIGFDLDAVNPVARAFDHSGRLGEPYFAKHHVTLTKGEQVVFAIRAFTRKCYCEWEMHVDLVVDGKSEMLVVNNHGKPFRTTSFTDLYEESYTLASSFRLVKQPPGSKFVPPRCGVPGAC